MRVEPWQGTPPVLTVGHSSQNAFVLVIMMVHFQSLSLPRTYKSRLQLPFSASYRIKEPSPPETKWPPSPETRNPRHNGLRRIQVGRAEHHSQIPKQSSWVGGTTTYLGILRVQGGCGVKTASEQKGANAKGVALKR